MLKDADETKRKVLCEMNNRIAKLEKHENEPISTRAGQYEQLDNVVSNIICSALLGELSDLKRYIEEI